MSTSQTEPRSTEPVADASSAAAESEPQRPPLALLIGILVLLVVVTMLGMRD